MSGFYGIQTWRSEYDHAHALALLSTDGELRLSEASIAIDKARELAQTDEERILTECLNETIGQLAVMAALRDCEDA